MPLNSKAEKCGCEKGRRCAHPGRRVRIQHMEYMDVLTVQTHDMKTDNEAMAAISPYWLVPRSDGSCPARPARLKQLEVIMALLTKLSIRSEDAATKPQIPDDYDDECRALITPPKRKRGRPRIPPSEDEVKETNERLELVRQWAEVKFACGIDEVVCNRSQSKSKTHPASKAHYRITFDREDPQSHYCANKGSDHKNNITYALVRIAYCSILLVFLFRGPVVVGIYLSNPVCTAQFCLSIRR